MVASPPTDQDIRVIWSKRGGLVTFLFLTVNSCIINRAALKTFTDPTEVHHVTDET